MSGFDKFEAIVTSDGTGEPFNACIRDAITGTVLATYKSSNSISLNHGMAFVGDSYLIAAQKDKPIILVWALSKKEAVHMRIICPGKPTALAVSHKGLFCIASFDEKFQIWQISDGKLLAVVSSHLQTITCIKFNESDSHFVTGAADGQVFVWNFAKVISQSSSEVNEAPEPLHSWNDHQLQVTDIHIGYFRDDAKVATVSSDQTCKIYKLSSGLMLLSFVLDVALTSVVMDPCEFHLYVGAVNGRIYEINLYHLSPDKDIHLTEKEKEDWVFIGHAKQVTSLALNFDGSNLLSGSYDNLAKVWHIPSKQCIRTINHKGPVLNVFYIPIPYYIQSNDKYKPNHSISQFKREMSSREDSITKMHTQTIRSHKIDTEILTFKDMSVSIHELGNKVDSEPGDNKVNLRKELRKKSEINHQLYNYALDAVVEILNMAND